MKRRTAAPRRTRVIDANRPGSWEVWPGRIAWGVANLAGAVAFLYVLGGVVTWLRLASAGLPASQGVGAMPEAQLLVMGLEQLVFPVATAGACAAVAFRWVGPRSRFRRAAAVLVTVLPLLVLAILPWSAPSLVWPLAIYAASLYVVVAKRRRLVTRTRVILAAVVAATAISLAAQLESPAQLPQATVTLRPGNTIRGIYISSDTSAVRIGEPESGSIRELPRDDVTSLRIGPATGPAPSRSLLSRVGGGNSYAATVWGMWCNGEQYSAADLASLCRTQPALLVTGVNKRLYGQWAFAYIRCPDTAARACRGMLHLATADSLASGPLGRPRPKSFAPVMFKLSPGRTGRYCARVNGDTRPQLKELSRSAGASGYVRLVATLLSEPPGSSLLRKQLYNLAVLPPAVDQQRSPTIDPPSDCLNHPRNPFARSPGSVINWTLEDGRLTVRAAIRRGAPYRPAVLRLAAQPNSARRLRPGSQVLVDRTGRGSLRVSISVRGVERVVATLSYRSRAGATTNRESVNVRTSAAPQ